MTDRNELRRLAEDYQYSDTPAALNSRLAFVSAASPDVVLGLLDEIERLKGECDFFSARSEEERTNRGLAEKDFHDAMELVRQYSAERDQLLDEVERQKAWAPQMALADLETLREVLGIIAEFDPAVTHGWAECVREMARSALKACGESQ